MKAKEIGILLIVASFIVIVLFRKPIKRKAMQTIENIKLSAQAAQNVKFIISELEKNGITNKYSIAAILAIIFKESSFIPQSEKSYCKTSNERIRAIFGNRVKQLTEQELNTLKSNDNNFFDLVYMTNAKSLGLGNDKGGDGFKYRGRGFNQLTGKYAYNIYGNLLKVDLLNKPDLLNNVDIATKQMILFFKRRFEEKNNKLKQYNSTGINDFKSLKDAINAFYHANAGWGNSTEKIKKDPTGGLKKAFEFANKFV
jgi:predicted chitinase